ncbi:MAG TPA: threonylcarbamoyl-AMP synthase, partial [Candidatus Wirthbacteria bacterium]|nr:threonylcarbamoyl-AMP synthase [Candidatus Wirthbacteria bacterium]
YKHYAPKARLILVEEQIRDCSYRQISDLIAQEQSQGHKVAVIFVGEVVSIQADVVVSLGQTATDYARLLFAKLRELDEQGMDVIIAIGIDPAGLGLAVMNRLRKAAGQVL